MTIFFFFWFFFFFLLVCGLCRVSGKEEFFYDFFSGVFFPVYRGLKLPSLSRFDLEETWK